MYKNRQHPTVVECRLFCCPILLGRCRFCSFLRLLSYRHTAYGSRFLLLCARYATSSSGASAPRACVCSAAPRTAACTSATDTPCARATDSSARRASSSVVGRVTCFFLSCVLRLVCPGGRGLIRSPSECARQRCERRAQRHAHRRRQQRRQQCPFCAAGLAPDGPERRRARPVQQEK